MANGARFERRTTVAISSQGRVKQLERDEVRPRGEQALEKIVEPDFASSFDREPLEVLQEAQGREVITEQVSQRIVSQGRERESESRQVRANVADDETKRREGWSERGGLDSVKPAEGVGSDYVTVAPLDCGGRDGERLTRDGGIAFATAIGDRGSIAYTWRTCHSA